MTRYISEPITVDRGAVRQETDDSLTANIPGLQIPAGSLLDYLIDAFSGMTADDRELFTEQLAIIFRYSGEKIDRVAQNDAVSATGPSTWTRSLQDAQAGARTVDSGTELTVTGLDGQPFAFATSSSFTFRAASTVSGVTIANPAVVTTSGAHGLVTGQQVTIAGAGGATAVNGTRTVTVLSGTTFSVPVNNTNAWTSGGTVYHVATAAGAVAIAAIIPGTDGNGLQSGAAPAQTLTWFSTVAVTAPTSGGVDAEDDDAYLDRLSDTKPLQLNAVAKADDLARWLRNETGVSRALALDNNDGTSSGVAGHLLGVPVDDGGDALNAPDMAALQILAQAITLTNLQVHIVAPTYSTITVVFTGIAKSGWDPADVEQRAEQAVLDFLDRSRWGLPEQGDDRLWEDKTTVYYDDIITILNNVEGFDRKTSLTINGGTADVVMTGPGALPSSSSTASGTVTL